MTNLIDDIKRDREAGTDGPWGWDMPTNFPEHDLVSGSWMGGFSSSTVEVCSFGDNETYYPTEGVPPSEYDARRIARVPAMEAALLASMDAMKLVFQASERLWSVDMTPDDHAMVKLLSEAMAIHRKALEAGQ